MPIYEYRCTECEHQFQKLIRNAGDVPGVCPECGARPLKKLFSTFSATVAGKGKTPCSEGACPVSPRAHRHAPGSPCSCASSGKCPF